MIFVAGGPIGARLRVDLLSRIGDWALGFFLEFVSASGEIFWVGGVYLSEENGI